MTAKVVAFRPDDTPAPIPVNGRVPPKRLRYAELRSREYLTPDEIETLMVAAGKTGRHGHRDQSLILIAYRHGLRVSELIALRWDQVDLKSGLLHVNRVKNGTPATHPLRGPELRALRKIARDYPDSPYVFSSERKGPLTASSVRKIVARAGKQGKFPFPVHPHMLRHACGYKLANDGHDTRAIQHYLGHSVRSQLNLSASQTKGAKSRTVMLNKRLRRVLSSYYAQLPSHDQDFPLIYSQKSFGHFSSNALCQVFSRIYAAAGINGASSHSGRRTFITSLASKGVSARVLMELAGHRHLSTTQRYIDVNDRMLSEAVELV